MSDNSQKAITETISNKCFSLNDQLAFANFSGDANPIHIDKIAARRTLSGQCIVHGMYSCLWALESLAKEKGITASRINARFLKPIFLDEEVCCVWDEQNKQLSLSTNELTLTTIDLEIEKITPNNEINTNIASRNQPNELTFSECSKLSNQPFKIFGDVNLARKIFPFFCDLYGVATACEIGAMSQVVGMECPGLHSLFSSLTAEFKRTKSTPFFDVIKSDERFKLLNISVQGNAVLAKIEAFYRPEPSINPHISEIAESVENNEFENIHALVIGGSRGLGEVVAKLIAAGGGKPVITYNVGKDEAEKVSKEIRGWGEECEITQLDVNQNNYSIFDNTNINQIYYFASPKILGKRDNIYDKTMLDIYNNIYVNSFDSICKELISRNAKCSIFYPSTVFIDSAPRNFENYVLAKKAGEKLCERLNKNNFIKIITARLPRLETDQNQSIVYNSFENKIETLLPIIKRMKKLDC